MTIRCDHQRAAAALSKKIAVLERVFKEAKLSPGVVRSFGIFRGEELILNM